LSRALGVPLDTSGSPPQALERLGEALASLTKTSRAVLVLDGADAFGAALRAAVPKWLERAPGLDLVLVSNERLGFGEAVPLGPLPADAAAQLFTQRLTRALTPEELALLPEVAERLEGVPLSLELAAAGLGDAPLSQLLSGAPLTASAALQAALAASLARLDAEWNGNLLLVTQNVDDLHERAGTKRLLHMHGEHLNAWCTACDVRHGWRGTLIDRPACPSCGISGQLRPDIVWFGEMPYRMGDIYHALNRADLFVSIGTSGAVYPAAGLVREARQKGIKTLELNLEPSHGTSWFEESRHGPATLMVPAWVDEILGG
jgi:NAD-dependent deacetylase